MSETEELVIGREGRSKATLGSGEEAVLVEVVMDAPGKDGFQDLAEHRGETYRAVGRGIRRRLVGFGEHQDAGGLPQVGVEAGGKDYVVESSKDCKEGERAVFEVAVGNTVMAGSSVAFSAEYEADVMCSDGSVKFTWWRVAQVLEARSKGRNRGIGTVNNIWEEGVIKLGIIGDGKNIG